jgi:hypothetical protein
MIALPEHPYQYAEEASPHQNHHVVSNRKERKAYLFHFILYDCPCTISLKATTE